MPWYYADDYPRRRRVPHFEEPTSIVGGCCSVIFGFFSLLVMGTIAVLVLGFILSLFA